MCIYIYMYLHTWWMFHWTMSLSESTTTITRLVVVDFCSSRQSNALNCDQSRPWKRKSESQPEFPPGLNSDSFALTALCQSPVNHTCMAAAELGRRKPGVLRASLDTKFEQRVSAKPKIRRRSVNVLPDSFWLSRCNSIPKQQLDPRVSGTSSGWRPKTTIASYLQPGCRKTPMCWPACFSLFLGRKSRLLCEIPQLTGKQRESKRSLPSLWNQSRDHLQHQQSDQRNKRTNKETNKLTNHQQRN